MAVKLELSDDAPPDVDVVDATAEPLAQLALDEIIPAPRAARPMAKDTDNTAMSAFIFLFDIIKTSYSLSSCSDCFLQVEFLF